MISTVIVLATMLSAAMTSGCALRPNQPIPWVLPHIAEGPWPSRWLQYLTVERQGRTIALLAVIENDGKTMTLVGLSPMGQRLMRITWSDSKIEQQSDPNIPLSIDGEAILRDVVFVHWPESSLQAVFAQTRWTAVCDGTTRTLFWNGRPWLSVKPETTEQGEGLVVDHLAEGYRVHVTTVERNTP